MFRIIICITLLLPVTLVWADHHEKPVYELRTYTANEGKLSALQARFRDHTMAIFEKHGMKNIGYWLAQDTPDTLIYILAHKDRDTAAVSWKAFVADPAWREVYQNSIADGRLVKKVVSVYMDPTDFSP